MNEAAVEDAQMATDPVCGMKVDIGARGPSFDHAGHTYRFCSEGCRTKFAADPERYLTKRGEAKPLPQGTLYTCPMHPECDGRSGGLSDLRHGAEPWASARRANPELVDMTRRFWVAVPLSLALLVLDMADQCSASISFLSGGKRQQ